MKKLCTLFAVAMLFTLAGCKDATANISDGGKALVTIDGSKITNNDIYQTVKKSDGAKETLLLAQNKIYDKEGIKVDDAMKKEATQQTAPLKSMYGDKLDATLQQNGYKNLADYEQKTVYPTLELKALSKKYVSIKSDSLFKTYTPVQAQILEADTDKKAKDALTALNQGKDFKDVIKQYGTTTTYKGTVEVYNSKSGLPTALFDKIKATNKKGIINSVISDPTTKKFYVVNITNVDPSNFKNAAIDSIVQAGGDDLQKTTTAFYLQKYDFTIYDIDIYNGIKAIDSSYLTQKK